MTGECDGYFDGTGIEFHPNYEDQMVYYVWSDPNEGYDYKKWLILCWFDTTFGQWNGFRYDLKNSRVKMSQFLTNSRYATFEEIFEAKEFP